jgi:hypothetical protein
MKKKKKKCFEVEIWKTLCFHLGIEFCWAKTKINTCFTPHLSTFPKILGPSYALLQFSLCKFNRKIFQTFVKNFMS